ncbi:chemotaxis protein CheW [Leptothrix discophora]|uniref:Chemotaxis protein CheW n=2 Tax=Leptothrix discophora TaxID=89 RepID=A0ABT9G6Q4_LEPDI|nr:chemotaxis protein CheW [Leptothrix discophora]
MSSPDGSDPAGQLLRLALGDQRYAVAIAQVREILKLTTLTALPLMPTFVCGVMNLRGAVVPVIDLADRLGLGHATRSRRSCVVIVESHDEHSERPQTLGLLVDAVHEVTEHPPGGLEPVPPLGTAIPGHYLAGFARLRGEVTPVLSLSHVLDEAALGAEIVAHAQPASGHHAQHAHQAHHAHHAHHAQPSRSGHAPHDQRLAA